MIMPGLHMRVLGAAFAVFLASGFAADAGPAERYGCSMMLCEASDAACDGATAMILTRRAGTGLWDLSDPEGGRSTFSVLAPLGKNATALVSTDIDPDASATGLMTIGDDGTTVLTVHGYFPALSHGTYTGTCKAEAQ